MEEPEEIFLINQLLNDLEQAEREADEAIRAGPHPRFHYKRRLDPFVGLSNKNFRKNYRFTKETVQDIIEMLRPYIREAHRASDISVETKVLVALHFFANGTYQEGVGKHMCHTMSQPSISRCIRQVSHALNQPNIQRRYIHFPENENELEELRLRFYQTYNFPGIIGIIDGTHIAIVRPKEHEDIYINRKEYHSLNVQLVCDHRLKIISVNARFPGSVHDARIWSESQVSTTMELIYQNIRQPFFLLGDLGYPLRPWLLTQLRHAEPGAEERYNRSFTHIRSLIERCNGRLKNTWRCLLRHRTLHYDPETAAAITNACAVLHNICVDNNIEEPDIRDLPHDVDWGLYVPEEGERQDPFQNVNADLAAGRNLRERIINNHFRH